jgi:hypothetical protein
MSPRAPVFAASALLVACGCSSYGVTKAAPPVAPITASADRAEVCVFRAGFPAPLYTIAVYDNGKLVGATHDGTYFCYAAEPGRHDIASDGTFGTQTTTLAAIAGRRYYLKQEWLIPAVRGHALSWIDEAVAANEMDGDEYAMLTEVPANESLPGAQPFAPKAR